jgi:hypothetical protein
MTVNYFTREDSILVLFLELYSIENLMGLKRLGG